MYSSSGSGSSVHVFVKLPHLRNSKGFCLGGFILYTRLTALTIVWQIANGSATDIVKTRPGTKDSHGTESDWSTMYVEMKPLISIEMRGSLGGVVRFKNNGDAPLVKVPWSISLNGSFSKPTVKNGTFSSIPAGGLGRIHVFVLGWGVIEARVSAVSKGDIRDANFERFSVFLFFTKIKFS